jgi:hypothetical protein
VFDPLAGLVETVVEPIVVVPEVAAEITGLTLDLSSSSASQIREGTELNDDIRTGSGDDTIMPRGGSDFVDGGGGSDTIGYSTNLDVGITIDLNAGSAFGSIVIPTSKFVEYPIVSEPPPPSTKSLPPLGMMVSSPEPVRMSSLSSVPSLI